MAVGLVKFVRVAAKIVMVATTITGIRCQIFRFQMTRLAVVERVEEILDID